MPRSRGRILRPLLNLRRKDVLEYLNGKKIPYRTDSTNADNHFLRNRIRNKLIPCLNELFPRWEKNIDALSAIQTVTANFLKSEAEIRVPWEPVFGLELKLRPEPQLRTAADSFFLQPEIIREEALFRGINMLDNKPHKKARLKQSTVKRLNVRQFSRGETIAADLGSCRAEIKSGMVIISGEKSGASQEGFSLLIKEPGLYKLNSVAFEVLSVSPAASGKDGGVGFFVTLPFVLRRSLKSDGIIKAGRRIRAADFGKAVSTGMLISAVDREGIAAFIAVCNGNAKIEAAGAAAENGLYFKVITSGGIDVQRYE
jgi:tRNA(Ile)-lysidine synthase